MRNHTWCAAIAAAALLAGCSSGGDAESEGSHNGAASERDYTNPEVLTSTLEDLVGQVPGSKVAGMSVYPWGLLVRVVRDGHEFWVSESGAVTWHAEDAPTPEGIPLDELDAEALLAPLADCEGAPLDEQSLDTKRVSFSTVGPGIPVGATECDGQLEYYWSKDWTRVPTDADETTKAIWELATADGHTPITAARFSQEQDIYEVDFADGSTLRVNDGGAHTPRHDLGGVPEGHFAPDKIDIAQLLECKDELSPDGEGPWDVRVEASPSGTPVIHWYWANASPESTHATTDPSCNEVQE